MRKLISPLLVFTIIFSCTFAKAASFNDLSGFDWAAQPILNYANRGIIQGIGYNEYGPSLNIKRGDLCLLMYRLLKTLDEGEYQIKTFPDVAPSSYYYTAIGKTATLLHLDGYEDGSFRPEQPITRAELAVMISYFASFNPNYGSEYVGYRVFDKYLNGFSDRSQIKDWCEDEAGECVYAGLMKGDDYGNFNPTSNVRRAEAAIVFDNIEKLLKNAKLSHWIRDVYTLSPGEQTPTPAPAPPTPSPSPSPSPLPDDIFYSDQDPYLLTFQTGNWVDSSRRSTLNQHLKNDIANLYNDLPVLSDSQIKNYVHSKTPIHNALWDGLLDMKDILVEYNARVSVTNVEVESTYIPKDGNWDNCMGAGIVKITYNLIDSRNTTVGSQTKRILMVGEGNTLKVYGTIIE
ncbi:MAG: S-layer homology domain-containing protein [Clostridiales bacterium]|jgi:hypothetical protein|nr:S-layer homology domain-containing protein [Clostridiales bacterium]